MTAALVIAAYLVFFAIIVLAAIAIFVGWKRVRYSTLLVRFDHITGEYELRYQSANPATVVVKRLGTFQTGYTYYGIIRAVEDLIAENPDGNRYHRTIVSPVGPITNKEPRHAVTRRGN